MIVHNYCLTGALSYNNNISHTQPAPKVPSKISGMEDMEDMETVVTVVTS